MDNEALVVSVSVAPYVLRAIDTIGGDHKKTMTFQADGPTEETEGFAIIHSYENGISAAMGTAIALDLAILFAKAHATRLDKPFYRPDWLNKMFPEDIVGVQVVPTKSHSGGYEFVGWAVYHRQASGEAMWVADAGTEEDAMFIGAKYAERCDVVIETQPWKE